MKWRFASPALLLSLTSCNAPAVSTLMIVNRSGVAVSFETCRHKRIDLASGADVMLVDEYRVIGAPLDWYCYRKRPFVVRTTAGEWRYTLWNNRAVDPSRDAGKEVIGFAGKPNDAINNDAPFPRTLIPIAIEPDGSLRAGRLLPAPRAYGTVYKADFPADAQPRGFPIRPQ